MLERPTIQDEHIAARLRQSYELQVARVEFLPLGADANTAVYRVTTHESVPYFLKIRKGNFEEISLLVPQFLHERGIRQVIAPLKTGDGRLWTNLDAYACALYPLVEGHDGFEAGLSDKQWMEFGVTLMAIHSLSLPVSLRARIPVESWSSRWREVVKGFQAKVKQHTYTDPVAAEMAALMLAQRDEIRLLVERAGQLASALQSQPLAWVLCHSDIHAGNLLLANDGELYIIDWDNPILAPKERDLMFIGGGVGDTWNSSREEDFFYRGYGPADTNLTALTYYRYERIVQDIAAFCEEVLLTSGDGADRQQGLRYFTSQFQPGGVLEIAKRTDEKLKCGNL
jgi:spectinomycin phosphotransferase